MADLGHSIRRQLDQLGATHPEVLVRLRLFVLLALLVPLFVGLQDLVREGVPRVEIRFVSQDVPVPVSVPVEVPVERVVERIVYVPVEHLEPAQTAEPAASPAANVEAAPAEADTTDAAPESSADEAASTGPSSPVAAGAVVAGAVVAGARPPAPSAVANAEPPEEDVAPDSEEGPAEAAPPPVPVAVSVGASLQGVTAEVHEAAAVVRRGGAVASAPLAAAPPIQAAPVYEPEDVAAEPEAPSELAAAEDQDAAAPADDEQSRLAVATDGEEVDEAQESAGVADADTPGLATDEDMLAATAGGEAAVENDEPRQDVAAYMSLASFAAVAPHDDTAEAGPAEDQATEDPEAAASGDEQAAPPATDADDGTVADVEPTADSAADPDQAAVVASDVAGAVSPQALARLGLESAASDQDGPTADHEHDAGAPEEDVGAAPEPWDGVAVAEGQEDDAAGDGWGPASSAGPWDAVAAPDDQEGAPDDLRAASSNGPAPDGASDTHSSIDTIVDPQS